MTEWVGVGGGFIQADVIRWKECQFERRGARRSQSKRAVVVGERVVTAEVLQEADAGGFVHLKVLSCAVGVSRIHRKEVTALKAGTEINRAYKTLVKGRPERLLWSDEGFRSTLSSKFLGEREHERFMAMATDEE